MAKDVFICFATEDGSLAARVCELLERRRVSCWTAPRDVQPGAAWDEAILHAIDASRAMVLILSSHANDSVFVKGEVNRAFAQGKAIFTFRAVDVMPAGALELYLARNHWMDGFPPPLEEKVGRLASAVHELLGRAALSPHTAVEQPVSESHATRVSARRGPRGLVVALGAAAALTVALVLLLRPLDLGVVGPPTALAPLASFVSSGSAAWVGRWDQAFAGAGGSAFGGVIEFTVLDGGTVEGWYESRNLQRRYLGSLRGTANASGELEGTWSNELGQEGRFLLRLDPGGRSFSGTYALGDQSPASSPGNTWSGTKRDADRPTGQ
jgi:hypothetical protein